MPARTKISTLLTTEHREELELKIASGKFTTYQGLSDWLAEYGYSISRDAIHRYAVNFSSKLEAIQATVARTKAIVSAVGDDENNLSEGLSSLVQHRLAEILLQVGDAVEDGTVFNLSPGELARIGTTIAALSRSSSDVKKHRLDIKARIFDVIERAKVETEKGGMLTSEILDRIREDVYGLVDRS